MPLLHGRLPLRLAELQLGGPAAAIAHIDPDFPTRTKGVVEKCKIANKWENPHRPSTTHTVGQTNTVTQASIGLILLVTPRER